MADLAASEPRGAARPDPRVGFWLLALVNLFVGSMVGLERTVLPILAEQDFGLRAGAAVGGFIVAFAVAKALVNLIAGAAADRMGRRRVLVLGWLVSLPVAPLLVGRGVPLAQIGVVAGLYLLLWAARQPLFGPLSDRIGRRPLIAVGMALQGVGLGLLAVAGSFAAALAAAAVLGVGTGMVYPVLIAAVADRVDPAERATALGIYRFFRDGGYAVGALVAGLGLATLGPVTAWTGAAFLPLALLAWATLAGAQPPDEPNGSRAVPAHGGAS